MSEQKDVKVTGNETPEKEQGTPETPDKKDGILKKTGNFFKKNGKKIGVGIGLVAAFAGGLAAEKIGLPFGKKGTDEETEEA